MHAVNFVKTTGNKQIAGKVVQYFNCNRSGFFKSVSKGIRSLKTQGSCKIDGYCTANLTVTTCKDNPSQCITVEACLTHYTHEPALGHLRLPRSKRIEIAAKLSQGVTTERIVRDSVNTFQRIHLLTRKYIQNVERLFSLKSIQKHSDDATSTMLWVKEIEKSDINPVLLYKPQGATSHQTLDNNDFVLCQQTNLQGIVMKEFGNNIICIDSTHKTTGYDFVLVTILVIDEFSEGYPVAWCLSTREDQVVLNLFLNEIKKRNGVMNPNWIMTDDTEQYYNSWKATFGGDPNKLLCLWHVDRAWRAALCSKVKSKERNSVSNLSLSSNSS